MIINRETLLKRTQNAAQWEYDNWFYNNVDAISKTCDSIELAMKEGKNFIEVEVSTNEEWLWVKTFRGLGFICAPSLWLVQSTNKTKITIKFEDIVLEARNNVKIPASLNPTGTKKSKKESTTIESATIESTEEGEQVAGPKPKNELLLTFAESGKVSFASFTTFME